MHWPTLLRLPYVLTTGAAFVLRLLVIHLHPPTLGVSPPETNSSTFFSPLPPPCSVLPLCLALPSYPLNKSQRTRSSNVSAASTVRQALCPSP
ncbi:uncharacterized protein J3D65DRAFT_125892 [Phyllosticta citribraziliensis]|uniref:Secreted protein n=1 Tax=Phyllosticta citribraziliensis TaxID=989973 RepID=A0ABR1LDJ5_9PEZI